MKKSFLPVNADELRGPPDFVLITGDAYVDHPSFGAAVIGRLLESKGYSVAVLAQPNWKNKDAFMAFGRPRLAFLITAGNIDSMVNNYTVAKKRREKDLYSPGGVPGQRPDRACIAYGNRVREAYRDVPIILGGLEASLRRLGHYDYWDDKVRRSILLDAAADVLVYGMGERAIVEIAEALAAGRAVINIRGTVYKTKTLPEDCVLLPPFSEITASKEIFAKSFRVQYENTDATTAHTLAEAYPNIYVVQNPPSMPLSTAEFDHVYGLPYTRRPHPMYNGGVPAIEEVRFSIVSSRGCFGGCHFCSLTFHQGRVVQSRSHDSILAEVEQLTGEPDFKGYIHDVGGPTANFRAPACAKPCRGRQCLTPKPCKRLKIDHEDYRLLLRKIRETPRVKKVFTRSGVRYDYLIYDPNEKFFWELAEHHISGQLKVAPEHVSAKTLACMGKPGREVYDRFARRFREINEKLGLKQFVVPYFMSSHPGCDLTAAVELAEYLRDMRIRPEQAQDFYPTPGTLSTCMYYTERDLMGKPVYVPKNPHEKAMQRALIQYTLPQNYELVKEALRKAGREDLIGFGGKCLIPPRRMRGESHDVPQHKGGPGKIDRRSGHPKGDRAGRGAVRPGKNSKGR